ncbi:hypothetical protein LINPERHAP2_LOCUS34445 [Linum perenne]
MQGVGVYTNLATGNMYYRGPCVGLEASRARVVEDINGAINQTHHQLPSQHS